MTTIFTKFDNHNTSGQYALPEWVKETQEAVNAAEVSIAALDTALDGFSGAGLGDVDLTSQVYKYIWADGDHVVGMEILPTVLRLTGVRNTIIVRTSSGAFSASALVGTGVWYLMNSGGNDITLPTLTSADNGLSFDFVFGASLSAASTTITAATGQFYIGSVLAQDTDSSDAMRGDSPNGSSHRIMTFNAGTQGGLIGTRIRVRSFWANSAGWWAVDGVNRHSGNFTTIFS